MAIGIATKILEKGDPKEPRAKKARKPFKIKRSKQWRPKCGQKKVMANDMKYARLLDENDIQSIMNCCQICFPNNQEYEKVIPKVKPNAYDIGEFSLGNLEVSGWPGSSKAGITYA